MAKRSWLFVGVVLLVLALLVLRRSDSAARRGPARDEGSSAEHAAKTSTSPPAPKLAKTGPTLDATPQPAATPPSPPSSAIHPDHPRPPGPDARPATSDGQPSEAALMARLRKARAAGQNELAIKLAREGNKRFPDSAFAPERHSILVHSLADNEQRNEARGEAEHMVNHYPDSEWVREIERFTGAHRHRNVRLNDAGEIEYY